MPEKRISNCASLNLKLLGGSPNTAHTTNPVPCFLIDNDYKAIKNGKLGDIAPTILKMMGVEIPSDMAGEVLV